MAQQTVKTHLLSPPIQQDDPITSPPQDKDINFFPHLPPYSDPTTGFLSHLPRNLIPYAQLMRLDRPAGLYAFYFPYLIGLLHAACISAPQPNHHHHHNNNNNNNTPSPPTLLLTLSLLLLPSNILLRGAACTWNDTLDQHFDRRVARCRHRPVARGAVSTARAHIFTLVQLVLLTIPFYIPLPLPLPELQLHQCRPHLLLIIFLFFIYAPAKRVTHYPQVILGVAFAWAVVLSAALVGVDVDVFNLRSGVTKSTLALAGSTILWTIVYDTIYAHQDIADDEKAGVKGMAVRFRESTKVLSAVLVAGQVGLLVLCGVWAGFGRWYFLGSGGGVAAAMGYFVWDVDLGKPESCGMWFHRQFWLVGAGYMLGLVGEYVVRIGRV